MNIQAIPPSEPLLSNMPSGREYHTLKQWEAPVLEASTLASMRAPPDPEAEQYRPDGDDSDEEVSSSSKQPVGAYPGTSSDYY